MSLQQLVNKHKTRSRFAWVPTRMSSGQWVWFVRYRETKIMTDGGWAGYTFHTIRRIP